MGLLLKWIKLITCVRQIITPQSKSMNRNQVVEDHEEGQGRDGWILLTSTQQVRFQDGECNEYH